MDNCKFCFFRFCNGRCNSPHKEDNSPHNGLVHRASKSSGPLEPFDPELSALARKAFEGKSMEQIMESVPGYLVRQAKVLDKYDDGETEEIRLSFANDLPPIDQFLSDPRAGNE